ncbi:molybdopterin-guanine dinucleotide biosynthesis protein B [Neobacillus sp. YIM B06451]|uniref:molybdopterin-guanine dinucleotide biosynthesis protein B n=1 Tax=Neobacillus sp. YIM B06451 TaxID=3070994 RepID=UPI00292F645B|nr:molybdopterin-guanine dinucleotide biosynthesis protein B [Neobacillus sp. YIM B06451]
MAMVRPFVIQLAGYQNSGKTTLAESLIRLLKEAGLDVASIKHHGHGGKPDIPAGKDSSRHISAGAAAALVEGGGRLVLQAEKELWQLEDQINLLSAFNPHVILIEGHKSASYPKIILLRNAEEDKGLLELENIIAAVYWDVEPKVKAEYPFYPLLDKETPDYLAKLILGKIECQEPQK